MGTSPEKKHFTGKNHDVTSMTSLGHVTSSEACPNDSPWALSYYRPTQYWNNYNISKINY